MKPQTKRILWGMGLYFAIMIPFWIFIYTIQDKKCVEYKTVMAPERLHCVQSGTDICYTYEVEPPHLEEVCVRKE